MEDRVRKIVMSLIHILLTFCRDKTPEQANGPGEKASFIAGLINIPFSLSRDEPRHMFRNEKRHKNG